MQCDSFCRGCVALESAPQLRGLTGLRLSFPLRSCKLRPQDPVLILRSLRVNSGRSSRLPLTQGFTANAASLQLSNLAASSVGATAGSALDRIRRIASFSTAPQSSLIPAIAGCCWSLADSMAIHLGPESGLDRQLEQPLHFLGGLSPIQRCAGLFSVPSRPPFSQDSQVPKWGVLDGPKTSANQLACNLPFVRVVDDAWLLFAVTSVEASLLLARNPSGCQLRICPASWAVELHPLAAAGTSGTRCIAARMKPSSSPSSLRAPSSASMRSPISFRRSISC